MSRILTTKQLTQAVQADGWQKVGQKGGHAQFRHPIKRGRVTIPYEVNRNIQLSVIRQAGLDRNKVLGRIR